MLVAVCLMAFGIQVNSQSVYTIKDTRNVTMKLSGTSTLHDWTMSANTFVGKAQFGFKPENKSQLTSVKELTFSLEVLNLKSDDKALNNNAYKALKTKQYKNIFYKLISAKVMPEKDSRYLVKTVGNLTIAGVTNDVTMDVYCVVNKDATITCTGTDKLKMTDYHVKPPSFMLGAMKTGDDITLDFTMVYKK